MNKNQILNLTTVNEFFLRLDGTGYDINKSAEISSENIELYSLQTGVEEMPTISG